MVTLHLNQLFLKKFLLKRVEIYFNNNLFIHTNLQDIYHFCQTSNTLIN